MELGLNVIVIYAGGAIGLGIATLVYTLWTMNQARASRERLRRIRRTLEGAR